MERSVIRDSASVVNQCFVETGSPDYALRSIRATNPFTKDLTSQRRSAVCHAAAATVS